MHGHTTELVTNLLLPGMYDVRSMARSKTGDYPLNNIDIIDGDDYDSSECVDRLRSAVQQPELQQLILSEILLDEDVVDALMDLLRSAKQWDALYLQFCEGQLHLAIEAILSLRHIIKIEIAGRLTTRCIETLSEALAQNTTLKELVLLMTFNEMNVGILIEGLKQNTGLKRIKFVKSTMLSASIGPMVNFLRNDCLFETIHFDRCNVADNDIAALVNSLGGNSVLKELYVGANLHEGCLREALSTLFSRDNLDIMSLHSSKQSSEARFNTTWMAEPLKTNTSLRILDLSENCLDDDSLEELIEAFCCNSTLEEVRFHENRITNTGAKLFGDRLCEMRGLKRIFLHRNRFDEEGAIAMLEGLRRHDDIEELTIPTMGRNMKMSKYQRLISYETCLNSGGKKLLKNRKCSLNLWPLVFERAGKHLWTPYCEYQMKSVEKWKSMQQADLIFHFIRSSGNFGRQT